MNSKKPFLTAEWRHLAMLNYPVDREVLAPYIPAGTVLDTHQDVAYLSLIGFLFLKTKLLGLAIPFHQDPGIHHRTLLGLHRPEGRELPRVSGRAPSLADLASRRSIAGLRCRTALRPAIQQGVGRKAQLRVSGGRLAGDGL